MIKVRWWLSAIVYVPFLILAMIVAPALPIFAKRRIGESNNGAIWAVEPRLPEWLNWFMTQENSLLGDNAWKAMEPKHWEFRKRLGAWPLLQTYLGYLGWLWRNPAYGLAWGPLAYTPKENATYNTIVLNNGYLIECSDGCYEYTRFKFGLKIRTGWILTSRVPCLFLLSIRFK